MRKYLKSEFKVGIVLGLAIMILYDLVYGTDSISDILFYSFFSVAGMFIAYTLWPWFRNYVSIERIEE